jgi:hypothetical protein
VSSASINGILHLYHRPLPVFHRDASTVLEHVDSFRKFSRFPVWQVNTQLGLPRRLRGMRFRIVVLHYSLFAAGGYHLGEDFLAYLGDECEDSFKVAFFQDEYHFCRDRFAFLDRYGVDCVYSCFEPEYLEQVYGRHTDVRILKSNIPGYVSDRMVSHAARFARPDAEREVDVGYRGRPLPPYVGRGGLEKYEIGVEFLERARGLGLRLDIACGEEDRIYGEDWDRFIAGCRAFLGTESGVSVVDLEDEVFAEYSRLVATGRTVTVEELERGSMARWQGIPYRTISPRHFEAAALRVCQILYEGRYSGAMEPMVHYIPLAKDFSNFDEVIELFRDPVVRARLTENARRDLIASGAWGYEAFVRGFDATLAEEGLEPSMEPADRRAVDRALSRGRFRRRARAHSVDFVERGRAAEFPGKAPLRTVLRPALRGLDRVSRPGRS